IAGPEFRCNTNVTSTQWLPAVAGLVNGGFVVAWWGDQSGDYDIYAQRYDATGGIAGSEFRCNTNVTSTQEYPAVGVFQDGGFVVVWDGDQTGDNDIYGQRYNATGGIAGPEFRCNTNVTSSQRFPDVAGLQDGGFVVVWSGYQIGNYDIYGQRYNVTGGIAGPEFRCNTNVTSSHYYPDVAGLQDGDYVVVWQGLQTGDNDIYGQRYNATGGIAGPEFRCNTNVTRTQQFPDVAGLQDGGFVVVWYGDQTGDYDIYGQRYSAIRGIAGPEFRCNTNVTSSQRFPDVAGLQDGGFVVVWDGYQTGNADIYAQRYDASGAPIVNFSMLTTVPSPFMSSLAPSTAQGPSLTPSSLTNSPSPFSSSLVPSSAVPSTTVSIITGSSSQATPTYPSITILSYETTYSITLNGLDVGTFTFSGGTGLFDSALSNTITLNIDPGLVGETFTLFTIPAGQEGEFQTIKLVGVSCQLVEGDTTTDASGQIVYQVIYQENTCTTAQASRPASAFFSYYPVKV
ncbi:MAG: hypothetical protein KBA81_02690, partial [Rhabdochlamydiaceae bacterium]|nr:hypothetical protein [Rhabdochlamydiaceae bacterium]